MNHVLSELEHELRALLTGATVLAGAKVER